MNTDLLPEGLRRAVEDDFEPVRPLPPHAEGFFTYGCFNNLIKVGPDVVRAWARILHGVPASRLLIKNASLSLPTVRARVEGLFAAHGVSSDRLQLMARVSRDAHLGTTGLSQGRTPQPLSRGNAKDA